MIADFETLILVTATAVLLVDAFGVWRLFIQPLREHRQRLHQQQWYRQEVARQEALRADERARRDRLRAMRRVAPKTMSRVEDAFTRLGAMHRLRNADDPLREKPLVRIQRVDFPVCLVGTDVLYLKLKLPHGTAPHTVLDPVFVSDIRLLSGFPDLSIIPTDRYGLWARVPARGSRGGIPNTFLWHTSSSRRNAMDLLDDNDLGPLVLPVGMAAGGRLTTIDLTRESDGPSILVAGRSGGGKSNMLNSMICTLLQRNSPETVRFYMVDMKHIELSMYEDVPHLARPVALGEQDAVELLRDVEQTMKERQSLFHARGVKKLSAWNERFPDEQLPYLIVVLDEIAMLMASRNKVDGGTVRTVAEASLAQLTAVGRAYGIHCILCTQRPSVDVITGLIKANVPTRIALTVASPQDSRTIINNGMAAGLAPVGRAVLYTGGQYTECQTPLIMDGQIGRAVNVAMQHAPPKDVATNERIFELMAARRWSGLPELYEEELQHQFDMTYDSLVEWSHAYGYSLPDCGPMINYGGEDYIMVSGNLIPVPDGPPTTKKELEEMEVLTV